MEDALAVDVLDGLEELVHVDLDLAWLQVFIAHQALVEILLHELENQGQFA